MFHTASVFSNILEVTHLNFDEIFSSRKLR